MGISPWIWRGLALGALSFGAALGLYAAGPPLGQGEVRALAISAGPVALDSSDPARDTLGRLRFLGGLKLAAPDRQFGGLSALLWDGRCQRLLAVTDTGSFLVLVPQEAGDRLTGVSAAFIAPILDARGAPPANKREADAESLSRDPGTGAITVWYEGRARASVHEGLDPCRESTLALPATAERRLAPMAGWPVNGGPEAVADAPGRTILISEEAGPGPDRRWLLDVEGSRIAIRQLLLEDPAFVPTALDLLEPGPPAVFLMLARHFSPMTGVAVRLDSLTLGPGLLRTDPIATFRAPLATDNFEGLAVRREGGRTFLYLVSDDNFSNAQQTLLLKFELLAAGS